MNPSDSQSAPQSFQGMTVNERLFVGGLMAQFEAAARRRDRAAMMSLLEQVELDGQQAAATTDALLANPEHYGY